MRLTVIPVFFYVCADLSKNRLSDVPADVCHMVVLETLNLYHNCIRTIPDSFIGLQSLTSLNLRYKWMHVFFFFSFYVEYFFV